MKLIIQIPAYNEAQTLAIALDALPKKIKGVDVIETLVINDGSHDKTASVAKKWGVDHLVSLKSNQGLSAAFSAGLDAGLRAGADIIVNTDADNQYCGRDIEKLIQPILNGQADIVIGERPIAQTKHFKPLKKKLQKFGSWVVRQASKTNIPDAPSGFRAYSRKAAMKINVTNKYTYTLETIIQAGRSQLTQTSVPIQTNNELRPSRLFKSMGSYIRKSMLVIIRSYMMYSPLKTFIIIGSLPLSIGIILGLRFLGFLIQGQGGGHIQSLILCSILIMIGFITYVIGLLADLIAKNRLLLEDIQYRVRKIDYNSTNKNKQPSKCERNKDSPRS